MKGFRAAGEKIRRIKTEVSFSGVYQPPASDKREDSPLWENARVGRGCEIWPAPAAAALISHLVTEF
jgi:hypothetical protein